VPPPPVAHGAARDTSKARDVGGCQDTGVGHALPFGSGRVSGAVPAIRWNAARGPRGHAHPVVPDVLGRRPTMPACRALGRHPLPVRQLRLPGHGSAGRPPRVGYRPEPAPVQRADAV